MRLNLAFLVLAAQLSVAALFAQDVAEVPPDVPPAIHTRQKSFAIPFRFPQAADSTTVAAPAAAELLVSDDRGQTWHPHSKASPPQRAFTFETASDGEYWYGIRMSQAGPDPETSPAAIEPARVELCVIVDTAPPRVDLALQWDTTGELVAQLDLGDPHLKADTLRLEYRDTGASTWQTLTVDPIPAHADSPAHHGQIAWRPLGGERGLLVRAQIADVAGNIATAESSAAPRPGGAPRGQEAQAPVGRTDPFQRHRTERADALDRDAPGPGERDLLSDLPPTEGPDSEPFGPGQSDADEQAAEASDDENRAQTSRRPRGRQISARLPGAARRDTEAWSEVLEFSPPAPRSNAWPPDESTSGPLVDEGRRAAWLPRVRPMVDGRDATSREGPAPSFPGVPAGIRPRMINATQFELEYEVEAVGPWGIRKVELWGTRDGGAAWSAIGQDDDHQSPLVASVADEGMYGFRILVQSGSGLLELPPREGDLPEIWIGVDLSLPTGHIVRVEQGAGERAGQLIIDWEAGDNLPVEHPISLAYRDGMGGPWTTIAAGLRNTGRFVWQPDDRVPDEIAIRLEVRDEAGNSAVSDYAEPIAIDYLRPKGRIRDVRPVQ